MLNSFSKCVTILFAQIKNIKQSKNDLPAPRVGRRKYGREDKGSKN